jgi:hypothetical protein
MCDRPQCFRHGEMCWRDDRWANCSGHVYLPTYYANMRHKTKGCEHGGCSKDLQIIIAPKTAVQLGKETVLKTEGNSTFQNDAHCNEIKTQQNIHFFFYPKKPPYNKKCSFSTITHTYTSHLQTLPYIICYHWYYHNQSNPTFLILSTTFFWYKTLCSSVGT